MTEPTDAALTDLWASFVGDPTPKLPLTDADKVAFARAVLAKWGAPAVAGEPVAWRHRMGPTDIWVECSKEFHDWVVREPSAWPRDEVQALCIATTQPTQAQAGAVPLTDEQKHARNPYRHSRGAASVWMAGFEAAELWYRIGIKGGQHGIPPTT